MTDDLREDLARLYDLYADRRYQLGSRLVEFDVSLPSEKRMIDGTGSSAVELLMIANEQIKRNGEFDGGYVEMACRSAVGLAGESNVIPDDLAFVYLPSRRVNARAIRSDIGRPVIVLDSSLFTVLPYLIANYSALALQSEGSPLGGEFSPIIYAQTVNYLAMYCATGEPRFLRVCESLDIKALPSSGPAVVALMFPIHLFLILHEIGHLQENVKATSDPKIAELLADQFAVRTLKSRNDLKTTDIAYSAGLVIHFQEIIQHFMQKIGVEYVSSQHPDAHERWHAICSATHVKNHPGSVAARLSHHFKAIDSLDLRIYSSACEICGRIVRDLQKESNTHPQNRTIIFTDDIAREVGMKCSRCGKFVCLGVCGLGSEPVVRNCPECSTRLACVIPVDDLSAQLASPAPIEQAKAAVKMVSGYSQSDNHDAVLEAFMIFADSVDLSNEQLANQVGHAAVTLILDLMQAGKKREAQAGFFGINRISQLHPKSVLIAQRKLEAYLALPRN